MQNRRRREVGGMELGELLAAVFSAFCVLFMVVQINRFGNVYAVYQTVAADSDELRNAAQTWGEEATSANSVFTPPTDVLGQSNADDHEFDILLVAVNGATKSNQASFIAYRRNTTANLLERYTVAGQPGNTAAQTQGFEIPATASSATEVNASAAPSTLPEAAVFKSIAPGDLYNINVGYPNVTAGNRELHVVVSNAETTETVDLVQGQYDAKTTWIVGTFTPTPGPCPSGYSGTMPSCTPLAFSTWPVELILGVGGAPVGTTCGCTPIVAFDPFGAATRVANWLIGGSVAHAAAAAQSCYALAQDGNGHPDGTLPTSVSSQTGMYVDANSCEVDSNDDPIQPSPAPSGGPSTGVVAYNSAGVSETYNLTNSSCNGISNEKPWYPSTGVGVQANLESQGVAAGNCTLTLGNGQSTQTPAPDAGSVAVNVQQATTYSTITCGFVDQEGDRGCTVDCVDAGCSGGGNSMVSPCLAGSASVIDFEVSTAEGQTATGSVLAGTSTSLSTSSDGIATINASACAPS